MADERTTPPAAALEPELPSTYANSESAAAPELRTDAELLDERRREVETGAAIDRLIHPQISAWLQRRS
jgi:hypothetical protein